MKKRGCKTKELLDLLESAWIIIANNGGGDWTKESADGWQDAATKWRDKYHAVIGDKIHEAPRKP